MYACVNSEFNIILKERGKNLIFKQENVFAMDTPPKNYNNINKKETTLSIILNVLHFCVLKKKKKSKVKKSIETMSIAR